MPEIGKDETLPRRLVRAWQVDMEALYARPEDVLEIIVGNAQTHDTGSTRFTDYEIVCHTNLPAYRMSDSRVRRRYSQFVKLRAQLVAENPNVHLPELSPRRFFTTKFDELTIAERAASFQTFLTVYVGVF